MSSHRNLLLSLAVAALFPIGLVACGGNDAGNASVSVTPVAVESNARARYVDEVCAAAARMFTAYQKRFEEDRASLVGMDPTDAYARTARQPFAILVADLEKLIPPTEVAP